MLLEGRFCGLRFYLGVRVTGVIDETRDGDGGPERVWGWCYQTLQGHLEQGRLSYEVIKNQGTGQVTFHIAGYSRPASIPNPLVRWGSGCSATGPSSASTGTYKRGCIASCGQRSAACLCRFQRYGRTASSWPRQE